MPSVANFSLAFDKINDFGTFSEGDTINGKVYIELLKPTKVLSLSVKAKREAFIGWFNEPTGSGWVTSFSGSRKLLELGRQFIISTSLKGTVLPVGAHLFPFNIQIPSKKYLPSSFTGAHGVISYRLEAKLWRMNKRPRKVREMFTFHSKSVPKCALMSPQTASAKANIWTDLSSSSRGLAELEVRLERNAFAPGETVKIVAKITNSSNHDVKPLFGLKQDVVYVADYTMSLSRSRWVGMDEGEVVGAHTEQEQVWLMSLGPETPLTIHNCSMIKTQYSLQVSLDALYSTAVPKVSLPEVCLPLVVIARDAPSRVCFPPEDGTEES